MELLMADLCRFEVDAQTFCQAFHFARRQDTAEKERLEKMMRVEENEETYKAEESSGDGTSMGGEEGGLYGETKTSDKNAAEFNVIAKIINP
jgi:hypothetical protein